jgi:methionyl-tRNA formyltransferase
MNKHKQIRCLVLLAREHGLAALKQMHSTNKYQIIAIFTHKFNPKTLDIKQKIRNDFKDYKLFADQNHIPLYTINSKHEKKILDEFAIKNEFEFLISISWRYLIPSDVFKKARYGAINLHRGDLPKYAGIEPIRRALENDEKEIVICCHNISSNYDEGEVIFKCHHNSNYEKHLSLEQNVKRLKKEITKYFPELTIKTIQHLMKTNKDEK